MPGLTISREVGESFTIGDEIVVTIVAIGERRVSINIVAPRGLQVDREDGERRREVDPNQLDLLGGPRE